MELGNDPFAAMRQMDNVPVMGAVDFDNIRMRCGEMKDPSTGEQIGVIIEWWFVPLPWFRFRMKLEQMHALAFKEKFDEVLAGRTDEEAPASAG